MTESKEQEQQQILIERAKRRLVRRKGLGKLSQCEKDLLANLITGQVELRNE